MSDTSTHAEESVDRETAAMLRPSSKSPAARMLTTVLRSREIAIAGVLLAVIVAATVKTPTFLFSSNGWRDLLLTPSLLILLAVGEAGGVMTPNLDPPAGPTIAATADPPRRLFLGPARTP